MNNLFYPNFYEDTPQHKAILDKLTAWVFEEQHITDDFDNRTFFPFQSILSPLITEQDIEESIKRVGFTYGRARLSTVGRALSNLGPYFHAPDVFTDIMYQDNAELLLRHLRDYHEEESEKFLPFYKEFTKLYEPSRLIRVIYEFLSLSHKNGDINDIS